MNSEVGPAVVRLSGTMSRQDADVGKKQESEVSGVRAQKTEGRRQKTEGRGQRAEDRGQRTEDRRQRTDERRLEGGTVRN